MRMEPRILFVEDHQDTRTVIQALLGADGFNLTTADSCEDGLRLAKAGDFDLYILDFKFADGTGKELCERIREFDPDTPILFFSGSHPNVQREALSCGAQGFILKPDFDELRREIRKNLRQAA